MQRFLTQLLICGFLIATWFGSTATYSGQLERVHLAGIALLLLLLLTVARALRTVLLILFLPCGLLLGWLHAALWHRDTQRPLPTNPQELVGWISEDPDIRSDRQFLTITLRNRPDLPPRILVRTDRYPEWDFGAQATFTGTLEAPEQFDERFDYPMYLRRFQIGAIMERPQIRHYQPATTPGLRGHLYRIRHAIEQTYNKTLPEPESGLMSGILLGSKRAIPEHVQEALRATGTSHIVAISGSNVTIVLNALVLLLPLTTRRSHLIITLGAGIFLSLLTGASASVVRGACVAALSRFLLWQERAVSPTSLLLTSAGIMVAFNPLLLRGDPGFQLSFGAYAGLLYLGKPLTSWINRIRFFRFVPDFLRSSCAETTAASLGTAPVTAALFGSVTILGLVVNPLILWIIPLAMASGTAQLLVGWIPGVTELVALISWGLLHLLLKIIDFFA